MWLKADLARQKQPIEDSCSGITQSVGAQNEEGVGGLKVKYIGPDSIGMPYGTVEEVISIEKSWYRVMSALDESYLFPPNVFEILEGAEENVPHFEHGPYPFAKI